MPRPPSAAARHPRRSGSSLALCAAITAAACTATSGVALGGGVPAAAPSAAGTPTIGRAAPMPADDDGGAAAVTAALAADVAVLAGPAYEGRETGTAGADSAVLFLLRRYARLGLPGAFGQACDPARTCAGTPVQLFTVGRSPARNVAVVVRGADAAVAGQWVVVGAHHDHIGRMFEHALDPGLGAVVRPGADDNASGTAAVLELARRLAARPPRRSVLLAHFAAEELGLVGSETMLAHMPVALDSVSLMVNLDMVGRLRDARLYVDVAHGGAAVRSMANAAAIAGGLRPSASVELAGRSDHAPFARRGIPAVALYTGSHRDYHRVSDRPDRVNADGLRRVVDAAERLVRAAADRDGAEVRR